MRSIFVALVFLFLAAQNSAAQSYGSVKYIENRYGSHVSRGLLLDGAISTRTILDFKSAIRAHPDADFIYLNSVGGSVYSALLIADEIHEREFDTYVRGDDVCLSACAYMFFAGKIRLASGKLGVHQISSGGYSGEEDLQITLADVVKALNRYSVNPKVLEYMLATKPNEIYMFRPYELESLEINRSRNAAESGRPSESKQDGDAVLSYRAALIGGRQLEILESDFEKSITVDGRILIKDYFLSFEKLVSVGGRSVILGSSGSGGNSCEAQYFILYDSGSSLKLDGPIASCFLVEYEIDSEGINFREPASPGKIAQAWRWTFANGIVAESSISFAPEKAEGWERVTSVKLV